MSAGRSALQLVRDHEGDDDTSRPSMPAWGKFSTIKDSNSV